MSLICEVYCQSSCKIDIGFFAFPIFCWLLDIISIFLTFMFFSIWFFSLILIAFYKIYIRWYIFKI